MNLESEQYNREKELKHKIIYYVYDLYSAAVEEELEYAINTGGVCSGMVLVWLNLVVARGNHPEVVSPDVSSSRQTQQYVECDHITLDDFPGVAGMKHDGRKDFKSLDEGLKFVWNQSGSYILLFMPDDEHGGHAFGFLSRDEDGYLLDPTNACYCVHGLKSLAKLVRHHGYVHAHECSGDMKLVVIKVGRKIYKREVCVTSEEDVESEEEEEEESDVESVEDDDVTYENA